MRYRYLALLALIVFATLLCAQEPLPLTLPQFSNPFYDAFTRNYVSAIAAGRGYTGIADQAGIGNALLNPAGVIPDSASIAVEVDIKPPVEAEGYPMYANYTSPVPFGMLGLSSDLGSGFAGGIIYNVPKSVTLDDFSFYINQGQDFVQRFPTYYLHQITANLSYHKAPLHIGLNLHNQLHYNDDPIFLRTYDRVRDYQYSFRIQPGIIYDLGAARVGLSMMPPSKYTWDIKYANYDALAPLWLSGGVKIANRKYAGLLDSEWEQTSAIDSQFSDRFSLKAGAEKYSGAMTYRLGYHYSSNVYKGLIRLASNTAAPDTSLFWQDVPDSLYIADNSQHSITIGLSYKHRSGSIDLSAMQTIVSDTPKTQINLSLSFYLSTFTRKKSLYLYD